MRAASLAQDFDRGMVPMTLNCGRDDCSYHMPHYHCVICSFSVDSESMRRDLHPCCRVEHVWINRYVNEPENDYTEALKAMGFEWSENPFPEVGWGENPFTCVVCSNGARCYRVEHAWINRYVNEPENDYTEVLKAKDLAWSENPFLEE